MYPRWVSAQDPNRIPNRASIGSARATFGLAALHIDSGQLSLEEPKGRYLGALDAYIAAPLIAVMWTAIAAGALR